jgi:hypothetical protein
MENKIPSRSQTKKNDAYVPPGAPREDDESEVVHVQPRAAQQQQANPFTKLTPAALKARTSLAGNYRVREGYTVSHSNVEVDENGEPKKGDGGIPRHGVAQPGEVVFLNHDDAVSVIRLTKDQRDPKSGRPNGPAIETETAYLSRTAAEAEHARFMAEVNGVSGLDALDS